MRRTAAILLIAAAATNAHAQTKQTCVDVQVGTAQSYDCLNQQLQQTARRAASASGATQAPYSATSPSNVTGQFNESATRNRLGGNFGRSVTPQRPPGSLSAPAGSPR